MILTGEIQDVDAEGPTFLRMIDIVRLSFSIIWTRVKDSQAFPTASHHVDNWSATMTRDAFFKEEFFTDVRNAFLFMLREADT